MQNRWDEDEARAAVERWGSWGEALALRVYTSRLIGAESALVLHGGGNTSVKAPYRTLLGTDVEALYVKGSGWDLASIEPQGLPAVELEHMRRVLEVPDLTDEQMVNEQRTHMFDASSPNPSIETLLHAFFPARFVDHSHADAILALTNAPDGARHVHAALGDDIVVVPYVKPGFDLAVLAANALKVQPGARAMVLLQHGLFTWGDTARAAYDDHIELVTRAERYLADREPRLAIRPAPDAVAAAADRAGRLAPLLRGALGSTPAFLLGYRGGADVLAWVDDPRLEAWVAAGPLTPDHVIRTKNRACVVRVPLDDEAAWPAAVREAIQRYVADYHAYVDAQSARTGGRYTRLDPYPRVLLVPGVGAFGVGAGPKDTRICLDITDHTLAVKEAAEALGGFQGLSDDHLFDVEYWSLEQAKLGKKGGKPLGSRVALITGGAGAIGLGIAKVLRAAGAAIVLTDRDEAALERAAAVLGKGADLLTVRCDVTQAASVRLAFEAGARSFGGVDVVVVNAGIAHSRALVELDEADWHRVQEVNSTGAFLTVRQAARHLVAQGLGGHVVLVSSKNVLGPGAEFGAYSASKAAAHQLCKVAALELAPHGVRVNMVAPDAVFAHEGVPSGLWSEIGPDRAKAKGLSPEELPAHYQGRNLLGLPITAEDVGRAVLFFASAQTPTTGATLPVDGGLAGAFPR